MTKEQENEVLKKALKNIKKHVEMSMDGRHHLSSIWIIAEYALDKIRSEK